jgi:hypothetical protein
MCRQQQSVRSGFAICSPYASLLFSGVCGEEREWDSLSVSKGQCAIVDDGRDVRKTAKRINKRAHMRTSVDCE